MGEQKDGHMDHRYKYEYNLKDISLHVFWFRNVFMKVNIYTHTLSVVHEYII